MGNNNSSNRRPELDPAWSQTYPRPRAWVQNPHTDDRYRPYSPPGNKSHVSVLAPQSLPVNNGEVEYIPSEMQADHLARYNR